MERVAILDLGSNTVRLEAFAYEPGRSWRLVDALREAARLSEGMGEARILRADAMERALAALAAFRTYCDASGIAEIRATATSAVRDAANGAAFLAAARERAGIELEILDGEAEAEAGTRAVANAFDLEDALVMDLGGGSAQLSLMQERRFVRGASWPIGAVRSTETYLRSDPPRRREVEALAARVRAEAGPFAAELPRGLPLVGMGGTLRNLVKIAMKREGYPVDLIHGYRLEPAALDALVEELVGLSAAERARVPGLSSDRADIIVAGAVAVRELVALSGASVVVASGHGIREGLFYPYLMPDREGYRIDDVRDFSVRNLRAHYRAPGEAPHDEHVRRLALALFDGLRPLHPYGDAERELLGHAALLHDIGMAIDYYDHHKHGLFLVMSRALPGFSHREQALIGLLVRYHRKGTPSDQGLGALMGDGDAERLRRLAGMLRTAEYLDRAKAGRVRDVRVHADDGYLQVEALASGDATLEVREARLRSRLLGEAFGAEVDVLATPA